MGKIVNIKNETKRLNIIIFLISKVCPEGMNTVQKKVFKRMCSKLKVFENNLYYRINGENKIFICRYETEKMKEIIRTAHTLDHVSLEEHLKEYVISTMVFFMKMCSIISLFVKIVHVKKTPLQIILLRQSFLCIMGKIHC
ncbi:hypothetical protein DMUE_1368 [Dictyocoela muelleri]|nr:hypothetical protein DMUE_1368 [Dictyocoela muelleri]